MLVSVPSSLYFLNQWEASGGHSSLELSVPVHPTDRIMFETERFKTLATHFPFLRDGRTGMQRATLGKSGSEAASQLQGQIAKAYSSNSLVNSMDMTAAIQYILTAAQSLGSQAYYKRSRMTILGLAGVLFCENEQA